MARLHLKRCYNVLLKGIWIRGMACQPSLDGRINICQEIELLKIPGYLRKELEQEFTCLCDYLNKKSLYHKFYGFLAAEAELNYFEKMPYAILR